MRHLLKKLAIWGLASLIGALLFSLQIIPAIAPHHLSSPGSTTTKPPTPAPSLQASQVETFVNQGLEKLYKPDYGEVLKDFTQVIQFDNAQDRPYLYRADLSSQLRDDKGAIEDYPMAIKQNLSFSYIYNQQGKADEAAKNYPKATENYTQVIQSSEDSRGYTNRDIAYYQLGNNQQVMENSNKTIAMNNGQADTYLHRGNLQTKFGNHQAAIANYQKVRLLYSAQGQQEEFLTANCESKNFMANYVLHL